MNKLKFSVSMCVYGGDNALYFDEALHSVFSQSRKPEEVVLVVDGPIPNSIQEIINKYKTKYTELKTYYLKENQGHGNARRYGFSQCKYDYIAIADADDINTDDRFEIQMNYFDNNPSLGAISSGCFHFCDEIDNVINEEKLPTDDTDIKKAMKTMCPICQPSVILNKEKVLEAGGYQDWYMAEDYYLWIRMMLKGAEFANTPNSLLYLRTTPAQMERRGGMKYFVSMKKLYRYMLNNRIINYSTYLYNITTRFIVQVLLPGKVRGLVRRIIQ